MSLETVRISQRAKDQLLRAKRDTGIKNWNILCRWALCLSLAEPSIPAPARIPLDSSVEMTWRTFAGDESELYLAIIRQRLFDDGLPTDDETVTEQFKLHLHRGVGYLFGDQHYKSLPGLIRAVLEPATN